jgi:glycosyltransferase involved in cell wall biosynthesis
MISEINNNSDICVVSVLMITYNQEKYIKRAIESVLEQNVDFAFELIIGDDHSTDNTSMICQKFASRYSNIIKYERNITNIGMQYNFLKTYKRCSGKYIALLEGDDEWVTTDKLKKQVKLMEFKQDIILCYGNAHIYDTMNPQSTVYFNITKPNLEIGRNEIVDHCVIPTCTVLFRNNIEIPSWWVDTKAQAYFLYYLLANSGKFYYIDEVLALYNHHYSGMSRMTKIDEMLVVDTMLSYNLEKYYNNDIAIRKVLIRKHFRAINDLFHKRSFRSAIHLFWSIRFNYLLNSKAYLAVLIKTFFKIHFLFFLSKNTKKGVY